MGLNWEVLYMKFGIMMPLYGSWIRSRNEEDPVTFEYLKQVAMQAEADGYHSIWMPDHLLNPIQGEGQPSIEGWTALSALSSITCQLKLAHTVLCYAFRHPAVLAKMGATLDNISGGRFILGMGACWFEREFHAYGINFLAHDSRVEAAGEAIQIIKRLWTEQEVTFKGKYFRIERGVLSPKPIQEPAPQIWYAGTSELSQHIAAEHADVWLFSAAPINVLVERIEGFEKKHKKRLKYALSEITILGETKEKAVEKARKWFPKKFADILSSGLIGNAVRITQKLERLEEIGVNYVLLRFPIDTLRNSQKFAANILPSFL